MDTLDLMRTFVAVVDSASFTVAGQRLGKSKALVSKHIYELEGRLGARLLNRTTRRVRMTEIGRAYYERARALLNDFAMLEEQVRAENGAPRGILRLTAPQTFGELELVEMLTAYRAAHPGVEIDILLADRMVDLVGEGFEVALRITTLDDSALIARKLCDMRLILCASPDYLARKGTPKTPDDLACHSAIVDSNIRWRECWRFVDAGNVNVVRMTPAISVNSAAAVHQALVDGQGVGLCPEFAVARDLRAGKLVEILPGMVEDQDMGVYIVYPHRLHLSAKVRSFIDFTSAWYAPGPPWMRAAKQRRSQPVEV